MTGNLIGYARVSTNEQNLELQLEALKQAGCKDSLIFTDKVSGAKTNRPGLDQCLKKIKSGDTLIVWRLDRLGRSMQHLVNLITELMDNKINFCSIKDGAIDTTTASGELMFHMFSALTQFERRLIQERTYAGLSAARARGKMGGRKVIKPEDPRVITAKRMHKDTNISIKQICDTIKISRATFYRYINLKK
jgi:DNA invertase Pin-like site-specific DNA recombinase